MDDSRGDNREDRPRPGARFDPVAGMRALADIQAEGLRAAGQLLERMLGSEPEGPNNRPRTPAGDYAAVVDAWTDLLRRTVDVLARPGQPGAVTAPVDASSVGPPVHLEVNGGKASADATAEVWLHNGTFSAVGPLMLHCGPLSDADGTVLHTAEVRIEPRRVDLLEPRSSRAVTVSLEPNGSLPPGTYRGTIQAEGAPRLWLPIEVTVHPC
jgi:hypothetical protein